MFAWFFATTRHAPWVAGFATTFAPQGEVSELVQAVQGRWDEPIAVCLSVRVLGLGKVGR